MPAKAKTINIYPISFPARYFVQVLEAFVAFILFNFTRADNFN